MLKFFAREIGRSVAIFALVGGIAALALAYSEPTSGPVGGTVYAPINTSGNPQTKSGNFTSSGTLTGNMVNANPNLCIAGSCASSWSQAVALGGGGGSSQWTTSGSSIYYNTGNVGIGTASPFAQLDVYGITGPMANIGSATTCCASTNPTLAISENTAGRNRLPWIQFHASGYQEAFLRLAKDTRVFEIGDSQSVGTDLALLNGSGIRMVYLSPRGNSYFNGGNFGIGTNSPSNTLTVNGTAWVTSGSWSGSDIRWKKNITPLERSLGKVLSLQGVNFEWNKEAYPDSNFTDGTQIGFIAQDVEKIIPEVVTTNNDGYKGIAYEKLVPVLSEAIKEQQREIDALKARIDELEKK